MKTGNELPTQLIINGNHTRQMFSEAPPGVRVYLNQADDPDTGLSYAAYVYNDYFPEIHCLKTGKVFYLDWNDIVSLAIAAGISETRIIQHG